MLGDSSMLPVVGNKSIKPQGTVTQKWRLDHKKSVRRSVRSGSIKLKQTYEHLMENGDIGTASRVTSSRARPHHDLDIKLLQAKRQQAEMYAFVCLFEQYVVYDTIFISFLGGGPNARRICGRTIPSSIPHYL